MSSKGSTAPPDLKRLLDKRMAVSLNGKRKVVGILRGFDVYCNLVLEEALEITSKNEALEAGTLVVRGNSIVTLEALEPVQSGA